MRNPGSITLPGALILQTVAVFLAAITITGSIVGLIEHYRVAERKADTSLLALHRGMAIRERVDRALSATYALAALIRQGNGEIRQFNHVAREMLRLYPGVDSLQLAPGGVVRQIEPLKGNELAIGHDLLKDKERNASAFLAVRSRQLTIAGPFRLIQGGIGAVGRLPVFLASDGGDYFWGFTTVLMRFPALLEGIGLEELLVSDYSYRLWYQPAGKSEAMTIATAGPGGFDNGINQPISVPNGEWILTLQPNAGWHQKTLLVRDGLLATIFSLLMTLIAFLLLRQPALLKHQVTLRTYALAESNQELTSTIGRLEQAQRQQLTTSLELQRFAEVSAHHLMEPSRLILSYSQRLEGQLSGLILDHGVETSLRFIRESATRMRNLVRDIQLYLTAAEPHQEIQVIDLNLVFSSLVAQLTPRLEMIGANIESSHLPPVLIDRPRIIELLSLLLDNAIQFRHPDRPLTITISGHRNEGSSIIRVCDNGIGIPAAYHGQVFGIFEKLSNDSSAHGTGIGLAIARKIVESRGGSITIESEIDSGCCVVVTIPDTSEQTLYNQPSGDSNDN
jgi:signal transduction histidine kinase